MRFIVVLMFLLLLGGCVASPVLEPARLPAAVVTGRATEASTGAPLAGVVVLATADRGGFWTGGSSYLLGHTTTDSDGRYRLELESQQVFNLARADTPIRLGAFLRGYQVTATGLDRAKLAQSAERTHDFSFLPYTDEYAYTDCPQRYNADACNLIRGSWGWKKNGWGVPYFSPGEK